MEKINHSDMVRQLAKPGADIIAQLTPNSVHLLHMAVGVSGEAGELLEAVIDCDDINDIDIGNLLEEFGDMEFYLEGLRQEMGFKRKDTINGLAKSIDDFVDVKIEFARLSMETGKLLDAVKKMAIYVKPINARAVMDSLKDIESCLLNLRQRFDIDHVECLEHNVNKLGERYKGHNYSNEQAQDRADKNEESDGTA